MYAAAHDTKRGWKHLKSMVEVPYSLAFVFFSDNVDTMA